MAGKQSRGVLQIIFKHFINSLKPRRFTGDLIGSDHFGNKYYETPRQADSDKKFGARYFEPKTKEDFEQEIPAEWEAWLRHRRKEPPTETEVLRNLALMNTKKKNASELDKAMLASKPPDPKVVSSIGNRAYPDYEEYKTERASKHNKD